MISGNLTEWKRYPWNEAFEAAFRFLETLDVNTPDGTFEIRGRDVYAMVQSYETLPGMPEKIEAHQKYADIQYTISGEEKLAWTPYTAEFEAEMPYNAEKDAAFLRIPADVEPALLQMCPGRFAVFFPEDGHWGKIKSGKADWVKKVCIKVAMP